MAFKGGLRAKEHAPGNMPPTVSLRLVALPPGLCAPVIGAPSTPDAAPPGRWGDPPAQVHACQNGSQGQSQSSLPCMPCEPAGHHPLVARRRSHPRRSQSWWPRPTASPQPSRASLMTTRRCASSPACHRMQPSTRPACAWRGRSRQRSSGASTPCSSARCALRCPCLVVCLPSRWIPARTVMRALSVILKTSPRSSSGLHALRANRPPPQVADVEEERRKLRLELKFRAKYHGRCGLGWC